MKIVHFDGILADMAGVKSHEFDVERPLDLINALNSQVPGFRQWAKDHKAIIACANEDLSEIEAVKQEDFELRFSDKLDHIWIVPSLSGSGIESALIAAGYSAFAAAAIAVVANLAISFVVSAVIQSLAPSPDTSEGPAEAANRPSFIYNGPKIVSDQGYAIPLIYGTHMAGGILIYTDLDIQDIPFTTDMLPGGVNGSSVPAHKWQTGGTAGDQP